MTHSLPDVGSMFFLAKDATEEDYYIHAEFTLRKSRLVSPPRFKSSATTSRRT